MNTWLITGCSSGLGKEIALAALRRGEQVVVTARNPDKLLEFTRNYPDTALALRLDLNDKSSMERAVRDTCEKFGRIDILVNNAGHGYRAAIEEGEPSKVTELFDTAFFAPIELIKLVLPGMRAAQRGTIVNVTSIGAMRGALGNGYYSAAKAALELASEALAMETQVFGVRVMLVEPGAFRTGFYGAGLQETARPLEAYTPLAQRYRKESIGTTGGRQGDPSRGGRIIVETVLNGDMPFRLLLGSDAVHAATKALTARLNEAEQWAERSAESDFR